MGNLNLKVKSFFQEQVSEWDLAKKNYEDLKNVEIKSFSFGDFEIVVQFNPARIVSSGAKVDEKTIKERKCFLCKENLPPKQKSVDAGEYSVLVNPYPIFPEHFTIPRKEHIPQQIKPFFSDMLELAKSMDDFVVFYNGPKCGASAPDHMHFQAGTKEFLPLGNDFRRLKTTHTELLAKEDHYSCYLFKNYLRTVYCMESDDSQVLSFQFNRLYEKFQKNIGCQANEEPMMNVVCLFENHQWSVFVFPRKAFRPWQYSAEASRQLMVSPATVEMSGIFITPVEEHFQRITRQDVVDILDQVSLK
jgi:ATP adenylyltransferase/5',5'''-P-1,P-4-tetraphosphate phosphorylase II